MSRMLLLIAFCAMILAATETVFAQTSDETPRANAWMEWRIEKMVAKKPFLENRFSDVELEAIHESDFESPDYTRVIQVQAAAWLSEEFSSSEFYLQIKFSDSDAAEHSITANNWFGTWKKIKIGNKPYRQHPNNPNLLSHLYDDVTLEIGSRNYVLQKDRGADLISEELKQYCGQVPNDHVFRIVLNPVGDPATVAGLTKAIADINPALGEHARLLEKVEKLRLSIDLSDKTMLELNSEANDVEQAKELQSGLDSILNMATALGRMSLGSVKDDESRTMLEGMMKSLSVTQTESEVKILVLRPEKFDSVFKKGFDWVASIMMAPMQPSDN